MKTILFLLFFSTNIFALSNEHQKLLNMFHDVYSGETIYQSEQLIELYENIDDNDKTSQLIWGILTINSLWIIMAQDSIISEEIQKLQNMITDIYTSNKKISLIKTESDILYYSGRFAFELMGFLNVYKIPKLSVYDAYIEYTDFFQAVITKNQQYVDESKIVLAISFSYPASESTNNWNTLVFSYIGNNSIDPILQYQSYLAQARIYIKTNRISQAKVAIQNAKTIFPNNIQAILMEMKLEGE